MCDIHLKSLFSSGTKKRSGSPEKLFLIFCIALLAAISPRELNGQFLHRDGKMIVDGNNNEIILRGMGLGGWMLQEGYMLETSAFANPQYEIRAKIEDLMGKANTDLFYEKWLANFCTKRDIDSLAAWGFNSVRLPMHYNLYTLPVEDELVAGQHTWLEKGFALTDSLIKWCAANSMYVILDLHAAPGGQGRDAAISDYNATKPSLWESEANKAKTIALWRKLAERYKDEKWVGGYDLINETNWNFTPGANQNGCGEATNAPLKKLFTDITAAIREVDSNHLIFIEGNCWANNHNGLFPAWDNNMAISFHKYWSMNDAGSIQGVVNLRNQFNLPLWMGEGGENSNVWFTGAIELLEKNKIGWAWWPMKKVNSVVNPLTIVKNDGYNSLLQYWQNGGTKPDVQFSKNALMQLVENVKIENNIYRKDVIDAMFRQVNDKSTRSFSKHTVPGVVHLSDFDLGRLNHAYYDTDTATQHVSTGGSFTSWNNGWAYRNDAVDLESNNDNDPASNGLNIGWTADGEWVQYTVVSDSSAAYEVTLRYSGASSSQIKLNVDGVDQTGVIDLPASAGWSNKLINDVVVQKGTRKIRLHFVRGGANVGFLKFTLSKKLSDTPLLATTAEASGDGKSISLSVNKAVDPASVTGVLGFTLRSNDNVLPLTGITLLNDHILNISLDGEIHDGDVITLDYTGTDIKSTDASALHAFTGLPVTNNLPHHISIPGKLEAEAFTVNQGLQLETTTDTGGGQNIGYTNTGDYLDYRIRVTQEGEYDIELRVASAGTQGTIEIQQRDALGNVLHAKAVDIPVTGGWQTWQTIRTTMAMDVGTGWLRLQINKPEFNLNWLKFTAEIINSVPKSRQGSLHLYPNPSDGYINIHTPNDFRNVPESSIAIFNVTGSLIKKIDDPTLRNSQALFIGDLPAGVYFVRLFSGGRTWTNKLIRK